MQGASPLRDVSDDRLEAELVRRRRARDSLVEYARSVPIPNAPAGPDDENWIFRPIETALVTHHRVILEEIQETMITPNGRLMIIAPPGSAKSTYASVVAPAWALCKWPGYRIITVSYADEMIRKHSRRTREMCKAREHQVIWRERPVVRKDYGGVDGWALTNTSEYMCSGIMGGVTGNRANGIVCDDLIAGREEADSAVIREKTMEAFRDDVETRLLPGGWIIVINTRWHEEDPCGHILPVDYRGQSGMVKGQDGRDWLVLNIPAKCEHADDPAGRELGEYLWPEWFPKSHWQGFENDPKGQRRWSALYQGRPTGDAGDDFKREWFHLYEEDELPKKLTYYGASDFAVTDPDKDTKVKGRRKKKEPDWTEHGVVGVDEQGELWFVDWWSGQVETDDACESMLDFVPRYRPFRWWDEGGVIDRAVRPWLRRSMRRQPKQGKRPPKPARFVHVEALPRIADKRAKCQTFAAISSARMVHFPAWQPWTEKVISQLVGFPAHRFDDCYDVCGLLGRGIDKMMAPEPPPPPEKRGVKPFTEEWLMAQEEKRRTRDV